MAIDGYLIQDKIKRHVRDNSISYYLVLLFALIGLVIGIFLSVTGYKYTSLLSLSDKNMFDYITGTASYSSIFYSRLLDCFLSLVVAFLFNLTIYTSFLGFIYLAYQMALIVLSSAAVISLYGFTGIINVIFFVVPINLLNFTALAVAICFAVERVKVQHGYKIGFFESFKETSFIKKYLLCSVIMLMICFIHSFILPVFIKSFVIVNY